MKATLVFVPPGGGEADYSLDFELPGAPQPGDYISIKRPEQDGTADFIVRRSWWHLSYPNNELYRPEGDKTTGSLTQLVVECEYSIGPYASTEHKRSAEPYESKGGLKRFEDSAF